MFGKIKGGWTCFDDDDDDDDSCVEIAEQIDQYVWDNQRIAVGDIASEMSITHGKKHKTLGENLSKNVFWNQWNQEFVDS
jgi:hypothetical protein